MQLRLIVADALSPLSARTTFHRIAQSRSQSQDMVSGCKVFCFLFDSTITHPIFVQSKYQNPKGIKIRTIVSAGCIQKSVSGLRGGVYFVFIHFLSNPFF